MMDSVVQEFFCSQCRGYFRVTLNMALNLRIIVQCPKCGRQHERTIEDGQIKDVAKNHEITDVLLSVPSSWSERPVFPLLRRVN
jgi:hypothetical protein